MEKITRVQIELIDATVLCLIRRLGELAEMAPPTWPRVKTKEEELIEEQLHKMDIMDDEGCFLPCWLDKGINDIWSIYM